MEKNIVQGESHDSKLGLIAIVLMFIQSLILLFFIPYVGGALLVVSIVLAFFYLHRRTVIKEQVIEEIKSLKGADEDIMRQSLINTPIPVCVIQFDGNIDWCNPSFETIVNEPNLIGRDISEIIEGLSLRKNLNETGEMYSELEYNDRKYTVVYNVIKTVENEVARYRMVLYWLDKTDVIELEHNYKMGQNVMTFVEIDGYDDVLKSVDEETRAKMKMEIQKVLTELGEYVEGAMIKIDRANYALIFDKEHLDVLIAEKFNVLDKIRDIDHGSGLPVTISMGVGYKGQSIMENCEFAIGALDLALGRGGDQVVVKTEEDFTFFGGKSKAVEKKNKVKSRLIGHALKQLITQSPNVLIMGHKYPDMDAMGAAVGVYDICKHCNKEAHIVLEKSNVSIDIFVDELIEDEHYDGMFIDHESAKEMCGRDTVVIVCDTHRPNFTECPELLEISKKKVVIDHHRRGVEFINDAVLLFHEIYVSSTCEMVSELIQYIDDEVKINKLTANGLMGGIFLDTKNFAFKTGVRTFEAASFLKKLGANTTDVKTFFNSDLEDLMAKAEIIKNTKIIKDKICISFSKSEIENINIVVAQSADELLGIKDVEAAFVLGSVDGQVFVSARSLGNINVHVMMEKLGGGGHIDIAGAQLEHSDIEHGYRQVLKIIEDYLKEEEEDEDESDIS